MSNFIFSRADASQHPDGIWWCYVLRFGKPFCQVDHQPTQAAAEERADLIAAGLNATLGLTSNPHADLGDFIYSVREQEGKGWDGPAVRAWSDAVTLAQKTATKLRKD